MAAKRSTNTAPLSFPSKIPKWSLAPAVEAARRNPLFARGEYVEVRRRLPRVFGDREVVIYVRAKVVSASPGTYSYLVKYPAAGPFPIRTARVAALDVRAARRFPPPPDSAVDAARLASSKIKRAPPLEQSECDCCKKAKIGIGKGIPKDILERLIADHEKEEQAKTKARERHGAALQESAKIKKQMVILMEHNKEEKAKKKEREHCALFLGPKLQPEKTNMIDRGCPTLVSALY